METEVAKEAERKERKQKEANEEAAKQFKLRVSTLDKKLK